MTIITRIKALRQALNNSRREKKRIGFVPTMGYLHEGHLSLVRQAKRDNDEVVVSIFVNPLQFGPKEDFKKYPRDRGRDRLLLEKEKVDFLFAPSTNEFYPSDFETSVAVRSLSQSLCGASRPTHFKGVTTVVSKLLNCVQPQTLYLGQKDYQQCRVIEQMAQDLNFPVKIKRVPTVRERDGLAMSSRNAYLSIKERSEAVFIYQALQRARLLIGSGYGSAASIKSEIKKVLAKAPLSRVDYVEIVDARTLQDVIRLKKGKTVLVALATYFGNTRLIDNILVKA